MSLRKREKHDCAVRAVSFAVGVPYRVAHAALKEAGRKSRKGTHDETIFAALAYLGVRVRIHPIHKSATYKDITNWVGRLPACLIGTVNHVFAAVDGVRVDESKMSAKVEWIAEIIRDRA